MKIADIAWPAAVVISWYCAALLRARDIDQTLGRNAKNLCYACGKSLGDDFRMVDGPSRNPYRLKACAKCAQGQSKIRDGNLIASMALYLILALVVGALIAYGSRWYGQYMYR